MRRETARREEEDGAPVPPWSASLVPSGPCWQGAGAGCCSPCRETVLTWGKNTDAFVCMGMIQGSEGIAAEGEMPSKSKSQEPVKV